MERNVTVAYIAAIFCTVAWGTTFVFSKDLMTFLTPAQLVLLRFAIAFVALWILKPVWCFDIKKEWIFVLMGLFGNSLYFITENTALTLTYTSNVSILVSTTSIMSVILLFILGYEKVKKAHVMGFVLAFIGVVFVVLNGRLILNLEPAGDILALAAALSWAIYGLILRKVMGKYDNLIITRKVMFYGILTIIPFIIIQGKPFDIGPLFTVGHMAELLFLALVGSLACYIIWNNSIKTLGVLRSNIFLYCMPLVALVAGAIAFDETITLMAVIGMIMIILGMIISDKASRSE